MLKTRIISAIVMLVLFSLDLFLASKAVFALVLACLVAASAWEWSRLSGVTRVPVQVGFAAAVSLATVLILFLPKDPALMRWLFLAGLLYWVIALAELYLVPRHAPIEKPSISLLLRGAVALLIAAVAMQYLRSVAPGASIGLLLYAFAVVWVMDIGAYFSGRRFGRRKLAPLISPGKSWEGVWGGLLATLVLLVIYVTLLGDDTGQRWTIAGATALAAAASVIGDLHESRLKRAVNMKDSSSLLPGHGGLLDRIDGVLGALPLFAFVWAWS